MLTKTEVVKHGRTIIYKKFTVQRQSVVPGIRILSRSIFRTDFDADFRLQILRLSFLYSKFLYVKFYFRSIDFSEVSYVDS